MKVIGLTGTLCSGKGSVKEIISRKFDCYSISLSSVIKAEMEKKKGELSRKVLQDRGNELRKNYGPDILARLATDYMQKDKEILIVDGIRNPAEVEYLRKKFGKNFFLIAVDAPREIRFERMVKRNRKDDPKTWEEFLETDERDLGKGEPEYGQQVKKCMEKADFLIINDKDLKDLEQKVEEIMLKIKK